MFDLFAPMPLDARKSRLDNYRSFLRERDGEMDLGRRTLARREESIARFERAPSRVRDIDRGKFAELYANFDPKAEMSAEMLLLLALTKINAAEAYGVGAAFGKAMKRALANDDDIELNLLLEETYHTRILLSSARLYGIHVDQPYTPPSSLRMLIGGIVHTPEMISRPITLCGEIIAVMMFANMLQLAQGVLKHDPELRDMIEERIVEVLVDEIGHISFNRMHMSAAALAQARLIFPLVARGLTNVIPELRAMGAAPKEPSADLAIFADPVGFPEVVRRQSFFA
jgi:hypothetical protein